MLKALKTRIIFQREEKEKKTDSGIVLTQALEDPNPFGRVTDVGSEVTQDVKVGDQIVVNWQYVSQMNHEGAKYYVVDQQNVLAVVEN